MIESFKKSLGLKNRENVTQMGLGCEAVEFGCLRIIRVRYSVKLGTMWN